MIDTPALPRTPWHRPPGQVCTWRKCAPGHLAPAGSRHERGASVARRMLFPKKQSPVNWENLIERFSHFRRRLPGQRTARNVILILLFLLLTACSTSTPPATPLVVTVYSTSAAQPWLDPLYKCAGSSAVISRVDEPASADIALRVGEPKVLASPAYQIDAEDILIVTHRQSPVQNLTLEEARALFAGQEDLSVQVWVYASDEDIQQVFDQFVMEGRSVVSSARVAVTPQQMSDILVNESNAVGILPRHWKVGDTRDVFSVAIVPVLVITQSEPQDAVKELIACLQK